MKHHNYLADLLDDLTHEDLTNLINWAWARTYPMTRANIKSFRELIGKQEEWPKPNTGHFRALNHMEFDK